jgi:hypothetical protein
MDGFPYPLSGKCRYAKNTKKCQNHCQYSRYCFVRQTLQNKLVLLHHPLKWSTELTTNLLTDYTCSAAQVRKFSTPEIKETS